MPSPRDRCSTDPTTAPLAHPTLAVAGVLLAAAVVELPRLWPWARDYGSALVYPAFVLYTTLAMGLGRWGWRVRPAFAAGPPAAAGID
ncbi:MULTISPECIES: hypothetical protein [Nocardia]|uniref:hypothetical protein n=1 Tax=Nocardia ignorata TaxID=145285 RepID=UPI003635075C